MVYVHVRVCVVSAGLHKSLCRFVCMYLPESMWLHTGDMYVHMYVWFFAIIRKYNIPCSFMFHGITSLNFISFYHARVQLFTPPPPADMFSLGTAEGRLENLWETLGN